MLQDGMKLLSEPLRMNAITMRVWRRGKNLFQRLSWRRWAWSKWKISIVRMVKRNNILHMSKSSVEVIRMENSWYSLALVVGCSAVGAGSKLLLDISLTIRLEWDCGYSWSPGRRVLGLFCRPLVGKPQDRWIRAGSTLCSSMGQI